MLFGSTLRNKPSRFLEEVPDELCEKSRSREWKKPQPGVVLPSSAQEARTVGIRSARNFGPVEASAPTQENFRPGDHVRHKTFGSGVILKVSPMGNDKLLEIAFQQAGTKKIMANYARLQKD